jgi:hypothetical protein
MFHLGINTIRLPREHIMTYRPVAIQDREVRNCTTAVAK